MHKVNEKRKRFRPRTSAAERLLSKSILMPNGCVEWIGGINKKGWYGRIRLANKAYLTHRLAYELEFGPIPEGGLICHTCDNPRCISPTHLYLGDQADNMRDMAVNGRSGNAKLTKQQVREIRALIAKGVTQAKIAPKFGVSIGTVSAIATGRAGKHII